MPNTIDQLGDETAVTKLIDRSIDLFEDNVVDSIGDYSFRYCSQLTSVSFPAATSIGDYALDGCSQLTKIILGNTERVATLASTNAIPSNAIIYVPDALVDSYKAATNWSTFADRIKGMSELPA